MTVLTPDSFRRFPMGPKLCAYLGLTDRYAGDKDPQRDKVDEAALTRFLRDYHLHNRNLASATVVDLLDELVTMDLPEAAKDLAAAFAGHIADDDFRAQLALGVAAMMSGDLAGAEAALRKAQATMPDEPAPYVNLVQVFAEQARADEAEVWCLAGLDAEPNNMRLWDLLAGLYQHRFGEYLGDELLRVAERRNAWAGLSLAAELTTTGDRYFKARLLERVYAQGERDPRFLVELTGAYGIAEDLEKIPPLVWQAERAATESRAPLPWQLHLHNAQAQLGLGRYDAVEDALAKVERDPALPPEVKDALHGLRSEAREGLGSMPKT